MPDFAGVFNVLKPRSVTIIQSKAIPVGSVALAIAEAILITKTPGVAEFRPDVFRYDLTENQQHNEEVAMTEHPVTTFNVTDHSRRLPDMLNVNGFMTDTPLPGGPGFPNIIGGALARSGAAPTLSERQIQTGSVAAAIRARAAEQLQGRSKLQFEKLRTIMRARQPVAVATSLKFYPTMLIVKMSAARDGGTGGAIPINLQLREIRINTTSLIPATAPGGDALDAGSAATQQGGSLAGQTANLGAL
jgi:hypothetical protein